MFVPSAKNYVRLGIWRYIPKGVGELRAGYFNGMRERNWLEFGQKNKRLPFSNVPS